MNTRTQIAAVVLIAAFLVIAIAGWITTQPHPTAAPSHTPRPAASPTPRALYAMPGRKIRQSPECYLKPNAMWRPLKYVAVDGDVWVLADDGAGCWGWMLDPS